MKVADRLVKMTVLCILGCAMISPVRAQNATKRGGGAAADRRTTAKAKIEEEKAKHEAAREKSKERKEAQEQRGLQRIDKREDNQAKRIQHGIKKGYLTPDEVTKLQNQQQAVAGLETSALSDGKLTKAEFGSIRDALNEASRCIWAEKHDTDGTQMAAYRFGANVFAKNDLTAKLADENLNPADAKALLKDFRRMMQLKHKLATEDMADGLRAAYQQEYDTLLNQYFEIR